MSHQTSVPIAICLEDLDAGPDQPRYLQCVALGGDRPGLAFDPGGQGTWQRGQGDDLVEICVSADQRLILYRQARSIAARVARAGRTLEVPVGKPVVLVDQDQLTLGTPSSATRTMRLHLHGEAPAVTAPRWLDPAELEAAEPDPSEGQRPSRAGRRSGVAAAAALALGTVVGLGGAVGSSASAHAQLGTEAPPPIEVRARPPKVAPPRKPDAGVKPPKDEDKDKPKHKKRPPAKKK